MKRWYVYILLCADGSLYTGATTDLARRLSQHNKGRASKYTRSRLPVKLLYICGGLTRSFALKEEHRIKQLPRPEKVQLTELWHSTHKEGDFQLFSKTVVGTEKLKRET